MLECCLVRECSLVWVPLCSESELCGVLQVLELYKTPLRVEGWDSALIETTRQRREACQGDLASYCGDVQAIPTLILTGTQLRQETVVVPFAPPPRALAAKCKSIGACWSSA